MNKLNDHEIDALIELLRERKELPLDYKYKLFPTRQKEYELSYAGKMRKEDLIANDDGVFPVPLQIEQDFEATKSNTPEQAWKNLLVFGDNLQFLKTIYKNEDPLIKDKVKGKVKLIYIDPPFATKEDFKNKEGAKAYTDKMKGSSFVEFLRRRLIMAKEILADDGSIFVHLDYKKSHYIKLVMDEVFGENNLINEIIWTYSGPGSPKMKQFNRKHDTIFWYSKSKKWTFNIDDIRVPYKDENQTPRKAFNTGDRWTEEDIKNMRERGKIPEDYWYMAIAARKRRDGVNRTGYPTEKPNQLLERIIKAASNEGDIVMDFFGGSGVTAFMAEVLGRKWITCDLGKLSFYTIQNRILNIQSYKVDKKILYQKKSKGFVTAKLGVYDSSEILDLDWPEYMQTISTLFDFENKEFEVSGYRFNGKKEGFPVKVFEHKDFKNSSVNENYLRGIHALIGKTGSSIVYVIAPIDHIDFFTDYYEIDSTRYYLLKVQSNLIKELQKTPFQKSRQPQSADSLNVLQETVGFHFNQPPVVEARLEKRDKNTVLILEKFTSKEHSINLSTEEKELRGFDTLSTVFIDTDYNGKTFELDLYLFRKDMKAVDSNLEIPLNTLPIGAELMLVICDVYGNDTRLNLTNR